ncbi:MmgE/PrpD family protein [Steroidobacter flavus]|uniref:MmgE/PrpD family protein n=1 Tax=Steroidobacter flavus TaxID=1842136 RepID=A0ABV8SZA6_9GAMM
MLLAERLADYTVSLSYHDLPEGVIHATRQRLVDTIGCALGAMDSEPVRSIRSYLATLPAGPSTLFFDRMKSTPEAAAFLNATMVRFLDYNDGYFSLEPGHSSDNIPACLAVAQAEGLTAKHLILAIVIAYEIQMRLQDVASLFRRGWDHVNFVTVSATLAVGKLLGLSKTQLVHALGMALNGHIALRQVRSGELSGWKGASAANASRNAVFCAYLAKHGMTGPSSIFEGEMGFFNQVSGPFELDVRAFGNRENGDFHILRARTKLYPTNGEMQTAVMAAIDLREQLSGLDDIATIQIDTTDVGFKFLAKDPAKWRPTTRETADHSLPYTVARALIDGTITRATYDEADLADPRVIEVIDKISVREDPVLAAQMPSLANRVTIQTHSGKILSKELGTQGNAGMGIADAQIERKFRDFARTRLPEQQIRNILEICWTLERQESLEPFFAAIALPSD